ncbi:MAG: DUF5606 domain-containing protein [Saprospiraceae bacterium]|nr:DUF5606 domain-containing protein [Saprospiraceae bacterium]
MIDLSKVLSVSGLPGLYEMVANRADGAIIKSYETGQSRFAPLRKHQFSLLETISIYTTADATPLTEIFSNMKKSDLPLPDASADQKETLGYFQKILPDYDVDRVSIGDIKKVIKWYGFLNKYQLLNDKEEKPETVAPIE